MSKTNDSSHVLPNSALNDVALSHVSMLEQSAQTPWLDRMFRLQTVMMTTFTSHILTLVFEHVH